MDKKYIELFKNLAQTTAATAEQVMDYDREHGDNQGLETATFMRNDFQELANRMSNDEYTLYKFSFKGLQDFYDFLKSNPKINTSVWSSKLSSVSSDFEFAGIPYKKAIEKLVQEMDPGYQEYLKIQKQMKATTGYVHKYREIKSIAGGIVNPVDYISGSPTIYRTSRIVKQPKFITGCFFMCHTTKNKIILARIGDG